MSKFKVGAWSRRYHDYEGAAIVEASSAQDARDQAKVLLAGYGVEDVDLYADSVPADSKIRVELARDEVQEWLGDYTNGLPIEG